MIFINFNFISITKWLGEAKPLRLNETTMMPMYAH